MNWWSTITLTVDVCNSNYENNDLNKIMNKLFNGVVKQDLASSFNIIFN